MTPERFDPHTYTALCNKVAAADNALQSIIDQHGYPPCWMRENTFESLVHIILEQQVSLASALAALNKLKEKVSVITPEAVLALSDEELKACYFSRQKTTYVRHLAQAILQEQLQLPQLEQLPDEEVRRQLKQLKGIGDWTADIYLMFVLQRVDIFPVGDLAAISAVKQVKGLPRDASREVILAIADYWKPYRTIATMLLWHYYLSVRNKQYKAGQQE
jgi:DNA-3-methyladenine glycosylase II